MQVVSRCGGEIAANADSFGALWCRSAIGFHDMIEHIRPEDFEIRYRSKNRFRFMGNGRTKMVSRNILYSC